MSLVFISRRDLHHVLHLEANLVTDLILFALGSSLNWHYTENWDGNSTKKPWLVLDLSFSKECPCCSCWIQVCSSLGLPMTKSCYSVQFLPSSRNKIAALPKCQTLYRLGEKYWQANRNLSGSQRSAKGEMWGFWDLRVGRQYLDNSIFIVPHCSEGRGTMVGWAGDASVWIKWLPFLLQSQSNSIPFHFCEMQVHSCSDSVSSRVVYAKRGSLVCPCHSTEGTLPQGTKNEPLCLPGK